jgi:hypothetical protein
VDEEHDETGRNKKENEAFTNSANEYSNSQRGTYNSN